MTADEVAAAIEAGGGPDGPLRFRGLHLHVGSQLGAADAWRDAVRRALALLALLRGGLPTFDTLDIGGGFPVAPLGVPVPDPDRFAREMPALLAAIPADRRPDRLAVEPGRVLVARAGWIVARVLHVRERIGPPGEPARLERSGPLGLAVVPREARSDDRAERLVVIDAGMTELVRPALYGAEHGVVALTSRGRAVRSAPTGVHRSGSAAWGAAEADRRAILAGRESAAGRSPRLDEASAATGWPLVRVDGPICETTDTFGEHRLPPLQRGDLVAIRDTGAYGARDALGVQRAAAATRSVRRTRRIARARPPARQPRHARLTAGALAGPWKGSPAKAARRRGAPAGRATPRVLESRRRAGRPARVA